MGKLIHNGITYANINHDEPRITSSWYGTQAEYDALSTYDNNTMYLVCHSLANSNSDNRRVILRQYLGDTVIFPTKFAGYNVAYEQIECFFDIKLDTGLDIFSAENKNRNFEFSIKTTDYVPTVYTERAILGIAKDTSYHRFELFKRNSNNYTEFFMVGFDGTNTKVFFNLGDCEGKDITFKRVGDVFSIYVDGTKIDDATYIVPDYSYSNGLTVGQYYSSSYRWKGLIEYFRFKYTS